MNKRTLAWTFFVVDMVSLLVAGWLAWLTRDFSTASGWGGSGFVSGLLFALALLPFPVVGLLIALRRPENAIGWILLAIGFSWYFGEVLTGYGVYGLTVSHLPAADWVLSFTGWLWIPPIGLMGTFALLLFPDGHLPSPRWRWFAWFSAVVLVLTSLAILLGQGNLADAGFPNLQNRFGVPGLSFLAVVLLLFPFCILGSAASLVVRFRRSRGVEREQLKLLAFAAAAVAVAYLIIMLLSIVPKFGGSGGETPAWLGVAQTLVVFSFSLIPLAIGVAILRHGLYEIELIIRKTVRYAVLVALLVAILVGALLVVGALAVGSGRGLRDNPGALVAIGAAIGLAFSPLRRLAARIADRLVFGNRSNPYEVLSEFSDRVGDAYAAEDVLPRMAQVLGMGIGADAAAVWLVSGGELHPAAVWPADADPPDDVLVDVEHRGERLGALSVAMPPTEPLAGARENLMHDLASQAGLVLRNVLLIEELRSSRRRLVAAQDDERRKIERNLHDGAQQQLVALAVQLKLARTMVERDPAKAGVLLDTLQGAATDALEDLRDLARGIYPPLLADKGLATALVAQARKAIVPVRVEADGVGRFPADVESAVYFSCLEALQNIGKYADANAATIRLSNGSGELRFEIRDDGRGFDPSATNYGTGLQGIADRLAALGGELVVTSAPGDGTA
ncbi:MAG: histidine kinase, partial [Actinomycetota bacterium]|nr:histidine kinase [Actinomycetota bacterium]